MTCDPQDHVLNITDDHFVACTKCGLKWTPEQTTDDLLDLMSELEPGSPGRKQLAAILKTQQTRGRVNP